MTEPVQVGSQGQELLVEPADLSVTVHQMDLEDPVRHSAGWVVVSQAPRVLRTQKRVEPSAGHVLVRELPDQVPAVRR